MNFKFITFKTDRFEMIMSFIYVIQIKGTKILGTSVNLLVSFLFNSSFLCQCCYKSVLAVEIEGFFSCTSLFFSLYSSGLSVIACRPPFLFTVDYSMLINWCWLYSAIFSILAIFFLKVSKICCWKSWNSALTALC